MWHNYWQHIVSTHHLARENLVWKPLLGFCIKKGNVMLEFMSASERAVGWDSTVSIPRISWLNHTPLSLVGFTQNRHMVSILDWVFTEHSQESLPCCFPAHSFQTRNKPKIVSVLSLKKKLWSFPCVCNVFIVVSSKLFSHVVYQTHWLCWKPLSSCLGWPLTQGASTQKAAWANCAVCFITWIIAEANEF